MEKELKKVIVQFFKTAKLNLVYIILFGSRARGDFTETSDWDILIILKESLHPKQKKALWKALHQKLHKNFPKCCFDVLIKSEKAFHEEKRIVNTIANEVLTEGKVFMKSKKELVKRWLYKAEANLKAVEICKNVSAFVRRKLDALLK